MWCPAVILLLLGLTAVSGDHEDMVMCHCNPTLQKQSVSPHQLIQARIAADETEANRMLATAADCIPHIDKGIPDKNICYIPRSNVHPNDTSLRLRPVCVYFDTPDGKDDASLAHTIHCGFYEVPVNKQSGCQPNGDGKNVMKFCTSRECNAQPIRADCPNSSAAESGMQIGIGSMLLLLVTGGLLR